MLNIDPTDMIRQRQYELQQEAERARLAALLPPRQSAVGSARRGLAEACYRLAAWLDAPPGYVQIPEAG